MNDCDLFIYYLIHVHPLADHIHLPNARGGMSILPTWGRDEDLESKGP